MLPGVNGGKIKVFRIFSIALIAATLVSASVALSPSAFAQASNGDQTIESVADFVVDLPELKSGTQKSVGPGLPACLGGTLCYIYAPGQMNVYIIVDILHLDRETRKAIMTNNALIGTQYNFQLAASTVNMIPGATVLTATPVQ